MVPSSNEVGMSGESRGPVNTSCSLDLESGSTLEHVGPHSDLGVFGAELFPF